MRAVLTPKSIETQFIKRVQQGNDHGAVRQALAPKIWSSIVRVCLYEDGQLGLPSCADPVQIGFNILCNSWSWLAAVEIHKFSFMNADPAAMAKLLP